VQIIKSKSTTNWQPLHYKIFTSDVRHMEACTTRFHTAAKHQPASSNNSSTDLTVHYPFTRHNQQKWLSMIFAEVHFPIIVSVVPLKTRSSGKTFHFPTLILFLAVAHLEYIRPQGLALSWCFPPFSFQSLRKSAQKLTLQYSAWVWLSVNH